MLFRSVLCSRVLALCTRNTRAVSAWRALRAYRSSRTRRFTRIVMLVPSLPARREIRSRTLSAIPIRIDLLRSERLARSVQEDLRAERSCVVASSSRDILLNREYAWAQSSILATCRFFRQIARPHEDAVSHSLGTSADRPCKGPSSHTDKMEHQVRHPATDR